MFGVVAAEVARRLGMVRPRLRLRPNRPLVKVNVGAGLCAATGWLHVDGSLHAMLSGAPEPVLRLLHRSSNSMRAGLPAEQYVRTLKDHDYVFYNLDRGLPFEDAVVDYVYSSHVLEHFYKAEGERLLREMYRVLKPGGVVRICVPDLEHAVRLYGEGRKEDALGYFFVPERRGTFGRHYYMYDYAMLSELLRATGFDDVRRCAYRQGRVPDLDVLDNRPEETLYVEAHRPASGG